MAERPNTLVIEDAELILPFRNSQDGREDTTLRGPELSVCVDPAIADQLIEDGWTVRMTRPRDEDETRSRSSRFGSATVSVLLWSS